jgi:hypothetical protein
MHTVYSLGPLPFSFQCEQFMHTEYTSRLFFLFTPICSPVFPFTDIYVGPKFQFYE